MDISTEALLLLAALMTKLSRLIGAVFNFSSFVAFLRWMANWLNWVDDDDDVDAAAADDFSTSTLVRSTSRMT